MVSVGRGGAIQKARLILLKPSVTEQQAIDMLWRREMHEVGSGRHYPVVPMNKRNAIWIRKVTDKSLCGLDTVLYTDFRSVGKIRKPNPRTLAKRAIASVALAKKGDDGISYLLRMKRAGIRTQLMPRYEKEILRLTGAASLKVARKQVSAMPPCVPR